MARSNRELKQRIVDLEVQLQRKNIEIDRLKKENNRNELGRK